MKARIFGVLAGLVGLHGGYLAAQSPGSLATDSARLQGTWSMVSGAANGYELPPDYVKNFSRSAAGNEVTVTMGGQLFFKATFTLNPAATPKTIDYQMTAGPTAGAVQLGIYSITGDTLRFCMAAPGAPRPAVFSTIAGDEHTLSMWVRAKP